MKKITSLIFYVLSVASVSSQSNSIDSLNKIIQTSKEDSSRILALSELSFYYYDQHNLDTALQLIYRGLELAKKSNVVEYQIRILANLARLYVSINQDTALIFAQQGLELARQNNLAKAELKLLMSLSGSFFWHNSELTLMFAENGIILARKTKSPEFEMDFMTVKAGVFLVTGNYPLTLETWLQINNLGNIYDNKNIVAISLQYIGDMYGQMGDAPQALHYYFRAKPLFENLGTSVNLMFVLNNIALKYAALKKFDSSSTYIEQSNQVAKDLKLDHLPGGLLNDRGEIYAFMGQDSLAFLNYRQSIPYILEDDDYFNLCLTTLGLAKLFYKTGNLDSSVYYANYTILIAREKHYLLWVQKTSTFLSDFYKSQGKTDSAFKYQQIDLTARDSLFSQEKNFRFRDISINEQLHQQEIQQAEERVRNKIKIYVLFAFVSVLILIAIILWRNNRRKQNDKIRIEHAYKELKSTQAQLIQSEKMASLGELTAGIAHEIQNPLNFVNNFSDVNKELVEELQSELQSGNTKEAIAISNDIKENEEKINHHGKRADAIVKGMLEHSRASTGYKESTDINKLANEYLRLSYHGFRAKDKTFNAEIKTDFDETLGKINVVPQDIGRVLLNLFNNAFYAISEKQKAEGVGYVPAVTVVTQKLNNKIEIKVLDNGSGIPQNVVDKIFQPFFTTKPTGQGTGLGLSLSYDIIKAHSGEIKVESKEGEGSEFIVQLPLV